MRQAGGSPPRVCWFPMDAPGTDRTPAGQMHGLLAIGAFGSATAAAFRLAGILARPGSWRSLAPMPAGLGGAMAACLLVMVLARGVPAVRARFGAVERGFYQTAIAWFAVIGVACATGAR